MRGLPIKVFGHRGTVRDYLYVSDLASGIVSALTQGHMSETYNLGSGAGLSNLDLIEVFTPLMRECGCEVRVENLPERAFDVKTNVLDATKLRADTGWRPLVTLEQGMLMTRDWLVSQKL